MAQAETLRAEQPGSYVTVEKADVTDACMIQDREGKLRKATTVSYRGHDTAMVVLDLDTSKGERYVLWAEHVPEAKKPLINVHGIIRWAKNLVK